MACRNAINANSNIQPEIIVNPDNAVINASPNENIANPIETLYFGVDSTSSSSTLLQHNLSQFEWVLRNKIYPNFWGRNIGGENGLTQEEIEFIHYTIGCKITAIYNGFDKVNMSTEQEGQADGQKAVIAASKAGFYLGNVIFLDIGTTNVTAEYMQGYAQALITNGYVPGFYANTDAHFSFCHQFSRGYQSNPELFGQCKIWAIAPNLPEFNDTSNAHNIHPDFWGPYCPSCMTQDQIAIWQYGSKCHPINDYSGNPTSFNINLIKDVTIIIENMF